MTSVLRRWRNASIMESVLDSCATRHGFHRVQTPTFERLDLFTAKSGAGIVDQLYAFQDRSDRHLTLRPELTAPVMRMIADGLHASTKPLRLAYHGPCFRYEESKKGRYREFFQYGVEVVGAHGPLVDAEVLALAVAMLDELGLSDWILRVGHVGILRDILGGFTRSDTEPAGSSLAEVMRLLDKGGSARGSGTDPGRVTRRRPRDDGPILRHGPSDITRACARGRPYAPRRTRHHLGCAHGPRIDPVLPQCPRASAASPRPRPDRCTRVGLLHGDGLRGPRPSPRWGEPGPRWWHLQVAPSVRS